MTRVRLNEPTPEVVPLPASERIVHARPVVGYVAIQHSAADKEATRRALERACEANGLRAAHLRVLARTRPGHEVLGAGAIEGVAASLDTLRAALREVLPALPPHDVLLLEGAAGLAHVRTDRALVVHGGRPTTEWPRELRALRSSIDLLLGDPRPETFRHWFSSLPRSPEA